MKKLISLFIVFLLTGCVNIKELHPSQMMTYFNDGQVQFGISDSGVYYLWDDNLYYSDTNSRKTIIVQEMDMEGYLIGSDIFCNDNRLYMLYSDHHQYELASLDLNGENYKTHIILDYQPQRFVMNKGKIYIYYIDFEKKVDYIEVYNRYFKLIDRLAYDFQTASNFYIENDEIIVLDECIIYENENVKVSYEIENIKLDDKRKVISKIQIEEDEYTFENKFVLYVNDKYFYTSSCTYPQTYERYHLNGQLDCSIVISEHIESESITNHLFEMDFSYIMKLRDENIAYGHSGSKIFEVDFEKGTCQYLGL